MTGGRTGDVTQPLVIPLWAMRPAVTHLILVETHAGRSAFIVAATRDVITADLILSTKTVFDSITLEVGRHAIQLCTWAEEVCVRAQVLRVIQRFN